MMKAELYIEWKLLTVLRDSRKRTEHRFLCYMKDSFPFHYCYGRMNSSVEIGGNTVFLFDIANELRETLELEDCIVEGKNLAGERRSLVVYYVQRPGKRLEEKAFCEKADALLREQHICIDGYREFEEVFPISPTTLKPQTRYTDGFFQFVPSGKKVAVSYVPTGKADVWELIQKPER